MTEEEKLQKEWEAWVRTNISRKRAELTIKYDHIDHRYDRQDNRRLWTSTQVRRARKNRNKWRRRILGKF